MGLVQGIVYAKKKDGAYIKHLDEYKLIRTHWTAFYLNCNNRRASCDAIYFDGFVTEHIRKEI